MEWCMWWYPAPENNKTQSLTVSSLQQKATADTEIRDHHNTFLCDIPGLLQVSFQTSDFCPEGCWFGQCLSVTQFLVPQMTCSPTYSTLSRLTTKAIALYNLIYREDTTHSWPLLSPGRLAVPPGLSFSSHWGAWRSWQARSYWIHGKGCESMCCCPGPACPLLLDQGEQKQ